MNRFTDAIRGSWQDRPLPLILLLALTLRLISAVFSQGYGWHDDHFLIVEPAHSWTIGKDYNGWLPSADNVESQPSGHSLTYPGVMYGIFSMLHFLGMEDPRDEMTVVRLLHALFSLFVVYFAYRIAQRLYGDEVAKKCGLILALFYFMPFMSVRCLVEFVCIPFLLAGTWFLLKQKEIPWKSLLLSGVLFGVAFSIRYQTILFTAGIGIVLLFRQPILKTMVWSLGLVLLIGSLQGLPDYLIWGRPFAEFAEYLRYNRTSGVTDYFSREWYMYFTLLGGMLIPPVSLMLLFGFTREIRKNILLALPVLLFLAFHSWFPNKQERFIMPLIPFIVLLGYGGWRAFLEERKESAFIRRLNRFSWVFFWSLNLIALIPVTVMYSKRSRVEAMSFLGKQQGSVSYITEDSNNSRITMLPDFYAGTEYSPFRITADIPVSTIVNRIEAMPINARPGFILFLFEENIEKRLANTEEVLSIEFLFKAEPSFMDELLHMVNPANRNEAIYLYKIHWDRQ